MPSRSITGFSKLSKKDKIQWIKDHYLVSHEGSDFESFWLDDVQVQKVVDAFSENTISNFVLPYGVAPNFLIDGEMYCVPMVIEESSVVAAASSAAKYWMDRGGFKTTILGTTKVGQVHFKWNGPPQQLVGLFDQISDKLKTEAQHLTTNMESRGGGITDLELIDFNDQEPGLYQLRVKFDTQDSMGANFINSVLESFAKSLEQFVYESPYIDKAYRDLDIIMSILSNNTPDCIVRAEVSCPIDQLGTPNQTSIAAELADKFALAVKIAHIDPYRAATHNKGIFNGIDSVVIATGNDFRAIEAAGHCYASREGKYRSLSSCEIKDGVFRFWLDIPLALGTVGGLTALHPLAKLSLSMLGQPSAQKLMSIVASVGLAQNFAAVKSLITTGIQAGHMKMHIINILNHLQATDREIDQVCQYFNDKTVSYAAVRDYHSMVKE